MAETTLLILPAPSWTGDGDAQLVAGDVAAVPERHNGRMAWSFDTTAEEAILSVEIEMPANYAAGALTARIHHASDTATSGGIRWDVFVEAKTPGTDTLDMETADSWDAVNSATHTMGGTAGDPRSTDVTLTNKDSVVVGDLVRFGIRRDTDHGGDTASGDMFIYSVTIFETI